MRMRAEQNLQDFAHAAVAAKFVALSQSGYTVGSDQTGDIKVCKWQPQWRQSALDMLLGPMSPVPCTFQGMPDEARFGYLVEQWRQQSALMSSTTEMVMCPAYQSIMAMGEVAVPLILRQLESEGDQPDNWFWALRHIIGANPVPDAWRGNRRAMADAWLAWARYRYVW
jgi:hypothetical protein